jgi:hypothetical protein
MNLAVVDRSFKVKHVTRQLQPPAALELPGRITTWRRCGTLSLHAGRQVAIERYPGTAARKLIFEVSQRPHRLLYEDQVLYVQVSLCATIFGGIWETGRRDHAFLRRHGSPIWSRSSAKCGWM